MEMETREEPKFIQFATGDVLEGVLVNIERVDVRGKMCVRYTVAQGDGRYVQFIGTYQLNTKLRATDKGHAVEIRCEGEDTMVKRGENCMKIFAVRVSKNPAVAIPAAVDDLGITDADIPF